MSTVFLYMSFFTYHIIIANILIRVTRFDSEACFALRRVQACYMLRDYNQFSSLQSSLNILN